MAVTAGRLFSRRVLLGLHLFLLAMVALFAFMAASESGAVRWAAQGVALAFALVWAAFVGATALPRRGAPAPREDGSVVIEGPAAVPALLVAGWVVMLLAVAAWVVVAVTDFSSIESPGFTLVMVLAAFGSLPDLVRLLSGRLHRWRLVADAEGVRYQGYHTDQRLTWAEVAAVRQQDKPPGVRIERTSGEPAVFAPAIAFAVAPAQIVEALKERRTRSLRR